MALQQTHPLPEERRGQVNILSLLKVFQFFHGL